MSLASRVSAGEVAEAISELNKLNKSDGSLGHQTDHLVIILG